MNKLMKGILISVLLCMGYMHHPAIAQDTLKGTMVVIIDNIESNKGQIAISLADSKQTYNGEHYKGVYIKAEKGTVLHEFRDIPFGTYAIKVYHDKNKSQELDKGMFGRPTEPYAFSNNASGNFGPARWEDAKFDFNAEGQQINIKLK